MKQLAKDNLISVVTSLNAGLFKGRNHGRQIHTEFHLPIDIGYLLFKEIPENIYQVRIGTNHKKQRRKKIIFPTSDLLPSKRFPSS